MKKQVANVPTKHTLSGTTMDTTNENITQNDLIKLRVSSDFKADIERFAQARQISVSALTRLALVQFIEKTKTDKEQ